jgi:hypothetical protein
MDILQKNWDSPLEYVISLFNTSYNTNITKRNHIQYLELFLKNNINVHLNEILSSLFILVPLIKVLKNPKIQMEHPHC